VAVAPTAPTSTVVPRIQPAPSPGGFADALARAAARLDDDDRALDRALRRHAGGPGTAPDDLLRLQAAVYRHAHDLELAAKLVDAGSHAIRRVLESQR